MGRSGIVLPHGACHWRSSAAISRDGGVASQRLPAGSGVRRHRPDDRQEDQADRDDPSRTQGCGRRGEGTHTPPCLGRPTAGAPNPGRRSTSSWIGTCSRPTSSGRHLCATRAAYVSNVRPLLGDLDISRLDGDVLDSFFAMLRRCRTHCNGQNRGIEHRTAREHDCDARCRPWRPSRTARAPCRSPRQTSRRAHRMSRERGQLTLGSAPRGAGRSGASRDGPTAGSGGP